MLLSGANTLIYIIICSPFSVEPKCVDVIVNKHVIECASLTVQFVCFAFSQLKISRIHTQNLLQSVYYVNMMSN